MVSKLLRQDLELYSETLDNGLEIYIVPKENVNGIYVTFSTKFGSVNTEFVPVNETKFKSVPLGTAHFLEHKMFEQEDNIDPFTFFSERGCDANAYTSYYKTTYLFSGTNAFYDNIEFLLNYVQAPYFTDSNVEKEKGIIIQELKMYQDNPINRMYEGILFNSFHKHPLKYPVGGLVDSVKTITKEDLYACYNTFYNPSNMFIVITGNVDPQEAICTIKNNQNNKKFDKIKRIKLKEYKEPNTVFKKLEHVKMDIEIPKASIAYKIDCSGFLENINDIKRELLLLFDIKLGTTSLLSEKLKNENLINDGIDMSFLHTDKHVLIVITFESKNVDEVLRLIEEELSDLKITEDELNRKKKVLKSNCIYSSDNIYGLNNKIMNDIFEYDMVFLDDYKKIDSITMKKMKSLISKIDLSNKTIYYADKS